MPEIWTTNSVGWFKLCNIRQCLYGYFREYESILRIFLSLLEYIRLDY